MNNKCCNKYGHCGTTDAYSYCSTECKPNYGKCLNMIIKYLFFIL